MNKRYCQLFSGIVALGIGTGVVACGESEAGNNTEDITQLTVTVPFGNGSPSAIPIWLGEELGYFEEEGIEVELVSLAGRASETVSLVSAGQADMVISNADTILIPAADGDDQGLKWLYTPYQSPTFGTAVLDDSDITRVADLEDGTVGMPTLGVPFEGFIRANIEADGGDASEMEGAAVTGAGALETLSAGDLDAYVDNRGEIEVASLATGIDIRYLDNADDLDNLLAAGVMVRADSSDEEMEAYESFLRSYAKAGIFSQTNPEAAVRLNWERFPASRTSGMSEDEEMERARTVLLATVDQFVPADNGLWGYTEPESWQDQMEYLGIEDDIDDVSSLFDNSLIEGVNEFDESEVEQQAREFDE